MALHHLSSTLTRPIQFKKFRVHVVFSGFPASPPTGASWSSSTWKLEMPISLINLFGLFRTRVDLRGPSKLCMGNMSVVRVGIDGGMRQHKNLLLQTRTYEVVEHLALVLYTRSKGTSFHGLVGLPIDICFNGGDNLLGVFALCQLAPSSLRWLAFHGRSLVSTLEPAFHLLDHPGPIG